MTLSSRGTPLTDAEFELLATCYGAIMVNLPTDRDLEPAPTLHRAISAGPSDARRLLHYAGLSSLCRHLVRVASVLRSNRNDQDAECLERLAVLLESWESEARTPTARSAPEARHFA